jgi:hypothetical protein
MNSYKPSIQVLDDKIVCGRVQLNREPIVHEHHLANDE